MATRGDHWSIGEVLSLLQDEFPDITISKIRFLESQGLISPERTPSGYRRFYESDFERLQWILVQQRDHYLPLKVIRDRLESGEASIGSGSTVGAQSVLALDDAPNPDAAGTAVDGSAASSEAGSGSAGSRHAASNDGITIVADSSGAPDSGDGSDSARDVNTGAAGAVDVSANDVSAVEMSALEATPEVDDSHRISVEEVLSSPAEGAAPKTVEKAAAAVRASQHVTERRGQGDGSEDDIDLDVALTKEELAEASGCAMSMILDLERFGLLSGREVGPTMLYDGEALMIARLAAQFDSYGLEARHLRTFRVGAEREVEMLFQVVEPMMHRRDPELRRKSVETLDDLVELAASLRAILMRQRVRTQLPSQRG